jgi:hypothetical protein
VDHDATHQHRPGTDATGRGVVVPLPARRIDRSAATPGGGGTGHRRTVDGSFTVDCAECAHRDTPVCDDCVVSFIVGREPDDAVVVDADEARAVRLLSRAGLVPGVRHEAQAGGR